MADEDIYQFVRGLKFQLKYDFVNFENLYYISIVVVIVEESSYVLY